VWKFSSTLGGLLYLILLPFVLSSSLFFGFLFCFETSGKAFFFCLVLIPFFVVRFFVAFVLPSQVPGPLGFWSRPGVLVPLRRLRRVLDLTVYPVLHLLSSVPLTLPSPHHQFFFYVGSEVSVVLVSRLSLVPFQSASNSFAQQLSCEVSQPLFSFVAPPPGFAFFIGN